MPQVRDVIVNKATEKSYSGLYNLNTKTGVYLCRQCGLPLFSSDDKFISSCGWPSFDEEITGRITKRKDINDSRIEILCQRCGAHLGHIFYGENLTVKNKRYCVNSVSLDFINDINVLDTEEAIFAGGCFWGLEYFFQNKNGILLTENGYIGGDLMFPNYDQVCQGNTNHVEAVRVIFDLQKTNYLEVAKFFFEIHDSTQENGQGPDVGYQYTSQVFVYNQHQENIIKNLVTQLRSSGHFCTTKINQMKPFWKAESYHQNYYSFQKKIPSCHTHKKITWK